MDNRKICEFLKFLPKTLILKETWRRRGNPEKSNNTLIRPILESGDAPNMNTETCIRCTESLSNPARRHFRETLLDLDSFQQKNSKFKFQKSKLPEQLDNPAQLQIIYPCG